MMRYGRFLVVLMVLAVGGCNLSSQPPTSEPLDVPTTEAGGRPVVSIASPNDGAEVTVGTQVFVTATATDAVGVTRMQLLANDQIVKTVSSESSSGQRNFQVILDYTPRAEGDVNLKVVAYRGALASDPAAVDIKVKSTAVQIEPTLQPVDNVPAIDPNDPTCRALTNTGLNLRSGPGTVYDRVGLVAGGAVVPIIGRVGDNSWWQIRYGINVGWVSGQYTSIYGICSSVPVIAAPPTPTPTGSTPTPQPTITKTPTPQPTITLTPGKADLVISSIAGPTSTTVAASPVTYSITITNTGSGPSGSFSNTVKLPNGSDANLGVVSNLNAGESISLNIDIPFTAATSYTLIATVDSASQINEVSEVNNTATLLVTVS
ncbi:MAG: SH3 domain-containing protein [Anaerolineaceae bacterium]|nr:SH3 domain-containing protein [Anaerolineaceae bacterium]